MGNKIDIKNRKAYFDYEILDKYVAGIVLCGTEVKSIRLGKAGITEAFCYFHDHELFVKGLRISEYENRGYSGHEPLRERKLLLKRKELSKLEREVTASGKTIIPLRMFLSDKGFIKLEIAIAVGQKHYDKRENIKKADTKRELDRVMKDHRK